MGLRALIRTTQAALRRRLLACSQCTRSRLRPGSWSCFNASVRAFLKRSPIGISLWVLLALSFGACREGTDAEDVSFFVDGVWPREATGVFLNEAIVVHFSQDVERTSITNASFAVRRASDGRMAQACATIYGEIVRWLS